MANLYPQSEKVLSLIELVKQVSDGDCLAIGGGLSSREPIAAVHELIRSGIKNLELVGSAHGIDVDMLCGAGAIAISAESYVGFEQDFGMAPNYRRACEAGSVSIKDNCCYTLVQQLRASISGVPFMPINSIRGTDFGVLHPEFKTITCPFTGSEITLVPPLKPDVALLHAHFADIRGNLHIEGPPVADILFAKASKKVIATTEKIITTKEISRRGVTIPYFYVSAIAEAPFGAHPTSCYPIYVYDRQHTALYYSAAKTSNQAFRKKYLDPYVFDCKSHQEYLKKIGGLKNLNRLKNWKESRENWMAIYD